MIFLKRIDFSFEDTTIIVSKYNDGESINAIANKYNVDNSVIKKVLILNKVNIRCIKKSHNTKIYKEKLKNIMLNKYGVTNISKLDSIKQKKRDTTFKHYGVTNPYQIPKIRKKAIEGQNKDEYISKLTARMVSENNPQWKGGITPLNKQIRNSKRIAEWRTSVFERDKYTCKKTGIKGGKLQAHHIENFGQKINIRFNTNNGITLSEEAHREFHKRYGIKNNNISQLNEFLGVNI